MIHPDVGIGAATLNRTVFIAESAGLLHEALPGLVVLLSNGLAMTLIELQLSLIEQELSDL